jgi:hypothetical protein
MFINETIENINPQWNADYGRVHFRFKPPGGQPYRGRDLYVFGEMTQYGTSDSARMRYNEAEGVYETSLLLKQGYYDYMYATREKGNPSAPFSTELPEANAWETENVYLVLVYYRDLGGRYDQLVGLMKMNSMFRQR